MSLLGHFEYTEEGHITPLSDLNLLRSVSNPGAIFTVQRYMFVKLDGFSFDLIEKQMIVNFVEELKNKNRDN